MNSKERDTAAAGEERRGQDDLGNDQISTRGIMRGTVPSVQDGVGLGTGGGNAEGAVLGGDVALRDRADAFFSRADAARPRDRGYGGGEQRDEKEDERFREGDRRHCYIIIRRNHG